MFYEKTLLKWNGKWNSVSCNMWENKKQRRLMKIIICCWYARLG